MLYGIFGSKTAPGEAQGWTLVGQHGQSEREGLAMEEIDYETHDNVDVRIIQEGSTQGRPTTFTCAPAPAGVAPAVAVEAAPGVSLGSKDILPPSAKPRRGNCAP